MFFVVQPTRNHPVTRNWVIKFLLLTSIKGSKALLK